MIVTPVMADVFLSYARPNARSAEQVARALQDGGWSVWFDRELPAHRSYADVIEEQLESAAAVVVLWSKDSVASQWVRSEANRARESNRLVQLRLDDTRLPMPFDQIQCADLSHWRAARRDHGWGVVEASVADVIGREPASPSVPSPIGKDRRSVVIGAGALGIAAAGGAWLWNRERGPAQPASPEAQLLLDKGLDALQQFDALDAEQPGSAAQAVALLTKATEANPDVPLGWGALTLAYAAQWRASQPDERQGLAERTRSAAARAFALEKNELRATAALRMIEPVYHNWLASERRRREAYQLRPGFPITTSLLADMLGSVGRWREAADLTMQIDRKNFLIPGADRKSIINLWAAGRLQEADSALEQAVGRWPDHPQVWRTRLSYLLYSGRPAEALRVLDDRSSLPPAIPRELVDVAKATGQALTGSLDKAAAVRANLAYVKQYTFNAPQVAQACVACGDPAAAMAVLDGYYFADGPWAELAPPGGDFDRQTFPLFQPQMKPVWGTPAFSALVARIGLDDYWRQSGREPDFRTTS
jgi:tetratricopeptide (TPR) repeat protein